MKKNPAVRSMLTIALYLVLLIGMWSVIGKWVYPTVTDRSRAEELVKKHSPLLIQLAENSADGKQWAGVAETETVQSLYETYHIVYTETEGELTRFYMKSGSADRTHALVYAPDGAYVPPQDVSDWTETATYEYKSASSTATAIRLSDTFFYEEVITSD